MAFVLDVSVIEAPVSVVEVVSVETAPVSVLLLLVSLLQDAAQQATHVISRTPSIFRIYAPMERSVCVVEIPTPFGHLFCRQSAADAAASISC